MTPEVPWWAVQRAFDPAASRSPTDRPCHWAPWVLRFRRVLLVVLCREGCLVAWSWARQAGRHRALFWNLRSLRRKSLLQVRFWMSQRRKVVLNQQLSSYLRSAQPMRCRAPDKICIRGICRRFRLEVGLLSTGQRARISPSRADLPSPSVCPSSLVCPCMPIGFIQEPGFSVRSSGRF